VDKVLEHDEGPVVVVVDRGHSHDRRLLDRRQAAPSREKALLARRIGVAQELETDDLGGGFVERTPHLGGLVASMKGRKPVATGDQLAFVPTVGDRRRLRLRAFHSPD